VWHRGKDNKEAGERVVEYFKCGEKGHKCRGYPLKKMDKER